MQKDIVFGVDQSFSSTGISIKEIGSGEGLELFTISTLKTQDWVNRSTAIASELIELSKGYSDVVLVVEGLPFGNLPGNSGKNLAGLQFVILSNWRHHYGMGSDYTVAPTAIKKFATGSGRASKDEMVLALPEGVADFVRARPKSKGRYDLADAWWLSEYYLREIHTDDKE
jgi:Holliday junction resolvasome RuvABC endonuclease subunit